LHQTVASAGLFLALQGLFITIEIRHAPFFGWIHDLSAPDPTNVSNLCGLLPLDPKQFPLIGSCLRIGAWPFVIGITMWLKTSCKSTSCLVIAPPALGIDFVNGEVTPSQMTDN
jgi:membrane protein insertase Oxa1/YidC/SpoIIIJ